MSIVEKLRSFWLGAEDTYDEGFDDLFKIEGGLGNQSARPTSLPTESTATLAPPVKTKIKEATTPPPIQASALKSIDSSGYSATNEVIVLEPTSFNQAPEVLQYLRRGSSIVLNLCKLDSEQSQRLIDFICGGIYALDGSQRRVGEGVFLLVPNCVNINSVENSTKESKLIHSFWSQKSE